MQFTATANGWKGGAEDGESMCFCHVCAQCNNKKMGKIRSKEKKTQKNNAKQQKKTLFYAIFIVKNFSNQKQKLTSWQRFRSAERANTL